jgi:hypothetical protein
MDRRVFMSTSLGAVAAGCAMPWLRCYAGGVPNDRRAVALVLFDSTLPVSRARAAAASEGGVRCMDAGMDVGKLWHEQLRHWPGAMRGVLRPSDCFVLRNFAVAEGRAFHSAAAGFGAASLEIGVPPRTAGSGS